MKKVLITLVAAMALFGAVYAAAASLTVGGVDRLGSGTGTVTSPEGGTVSVTDVSWTIDPSDVTVVSGVDVALYATEVTTCDVGLNVDSVAVGINTGVATVVGTTTTTFDDDGWGLSLVAVDIASVDVTLACE